MVDVATGGDSGEQVPLVIKVSFQPLICTLRFQLEDTVLLIGTLLLFDPALFPKYEA